MDCLKLGMKYQYFIQSNLLSTSFHSVKHDALRAEVLEKIRMRSPLLMRNDWRITAFSNWLQMTKIIMY